MNYLDQRNSIHGYFLKATTKCLEFCMVLPKLPQLLANAKIFFLAFYNKVFFKFYANHSGYESAHQTSYSLNFNFIIFNQDLFTFVLNLIFPVGCE